MIPPKTKKKTTQGGNAWWNDWNIFFSFQIHCWPRQGKINAQSMHMQLIVLVALYLRRTY